MKEDIYHNQEWLGILEGIQQNPDEDDRRLIAADWLEDYEWEHWAQVIRRQIERSRCKDFVPSEGECKLIQSLGHDLLYRLPKYFILQADTIGIGRYSSNCVLYRGFIQHLEGLWQDWLRFQDQGEFLTRHPIQSVGLQGNISLQRTYDPDRGTMAFSINYYPHLYVEVSVRNYAATRPHLERDLIYQIIREIFQRRWPRIKFFFRSYQLQPVDTLEQE